VAHTTIRRWGQRYVPAFEKHGQRYARPGGTSWRVDETDIRIRGNWGYLYRAVDAAGRTVDFFVSAPRDSAAAKHFLPQAINKRGVPQKSTLEGYAASHAAVAELQAENVLRGNLIVRTNRYLNNGIEQDHRRVKQRVRSRLGFTHRTHAAITIRGMERVHQIKKQQFDVVVLCSPRTRPLQIWEAVLTA
jgi:transposase-like protein